MLSALGGALVGAMVAMLVTPQSGKELRGKIREAIDDARERMCSTKDGAVCDCDK